MSGTGPFVKLYLDLRKGMVDRRGAAVDGAGKVVTGVTGATLPKTTPEDVLAITALFYPYLKRSLEKRRFQAMFTGFRVEKVDIDTWFRLGIPTDDMLVRTILGHAAMAATENAESVETVISKWNALIASSGAAWYVKPLAPGPMNAELTLQWWKQLYGFLIALEVLGEQPDEGTLTRVWDGIKYAATGTVKDLGDAAKVGAEAAGEMIAHGAQLAGEAAGRVAQGFFANAGLTAWIVVGGAIYLALP